MLVTDHVSHRVDRSLHNRDQLLDDVLSARAKFEQQATLAAQESRAYKVAATAYEFERDKGDLDVPLWDHIMKVIRRVETNYTGRVSPEDLIHLRILTLLHEILELKDDNRRPIWTINNLRDLGFSEPILNDVEALAKRPGELYLDYIQRVAQHPFALMVKLCDLEENMSASRGLHNPVGAEEVIQLKKTVLYPMSYDYLLAVNNGRIDPRTVSVLQFAVQSRATNQDIDVLLRHTTQKQNATEGYVYDIPSNV